MADCRAVFSTAGNQLISEAIHFGKPLLVMPEASLEQRLNARFVEEWGIGMSTLPREVSGGLLRAFLAREDEFAGRIGGIRRDGLDEALAAIRRAVRDLTGRRGPARAFARKGGAPLPPPRR
jgi:UDP-N-acetylglucosamine:LPS N-acetylglucosamine transferase